MKKLFVIPIIFLTLLAFASAATERNYSANMAGEASAGGNGGGLRWVQTFTLGQTGVSGNSPMAITNISIFAAATSQGFVNFTLQTVNASGSPEGNVIAWGVWDTAAATSRANPTNITFLNRTVLQGSTKYALVNDGGISGFDTSQNQGYTGGNITINQQLQPESVRFIVWGQNDTLFVQTGAGGNLSGTPTINATSFGFTRVAPANITWFVWNQTGSLVNESVRSIGGSNVTQATLQVSGLTIFQTYTFNAVACPNGFSISNCTFGLNKSFFLGFSEDNAFYNTTTYETAREGFTLNISAASPIQSASLWYNGTEYTGATIDSSTGFVSRTIDIPASAGTKNWFLSLLFSTGNAANTSVRTQAVSAVNFSICGSSPLTTSYINTSFKNETSIQENIKATIVSTWNYWLGSGTASKTLSYTNSTESGSYSFCFSPSDKTAYINTSINYANSGSQQRTYRSGTLTLSNTTTNLTLYLLPNSDGSFVTFQIVSSAFQPLSGALVNVSRAGFGIVEQTTTADAGTATFFLNPNVQYTVCASKDTYGSFCTTDSFTQSSYTITLGSATSQNATQDYGRGVTTSIIPSGFTLQNGTNYQFNFTLNSSYWSVTNFGFILKNGQGVTVGTDTESGSNGVASALVNTGNNGTFTMNAFWLINGSYTNITHTWVILSTADTGYSILNFFNRLAFYVNESDSDTDGILGLENPNGSTFNLSLIFFFAIFCGAGFVSFKYGLNSPFAVMGFVFAFTYLFDIVFGFIPRPGNGMPIATIVVALIVIATGLREFSR